MTLLVAHRAPLTAERCARLAAAGATVFEVDVQLWDGDLIVSHYEPFLGSWRWLRRDGRHFLLKHNPRFEPPLTRMLDATPPGARILLDLKAFGADDAAGLIGAIVDTLTERQRFVACTSSSEQLERLREKGFHTWLTITSNAELDLALRRDRLPHDAVTVKHQLLSEATIRRLHDVVPDVMAWTVNSVRRARALRDIGVDGITTDRIDVIAAIQGTM